MASADGNYSINPWMRPEVRLGDEVDPSVWLDAGQTLEALGAFDPVPAPAPIRPRFGYPEGEPGIVEVLNVGPFPGLRETDAGQQGTARPGTGVW